MLTLFGFQRPRLRFFKLTANGKGLCEVRATATESGEGDETLAKTIFVFSNLQKNKKRNGFLRVFSIISLRFPSTPHLAKPMLSVVFLINIPICFWFSS